MKIKIKQIITLGILLFIGILFFTEPVHSQTLNISSAISEGSNIIGYLIVGTICFLWGILNSN